MVYWYISSIRCFKKAVSLFLFLWVFAFLLSQQSHAFECSLFLDNLEAKNRNTHSPITLALTNYSFPEEGTFFTGEPALRYAIYEAFEGIDFYTGEPLPFDQMTIDHVVPKSKGGPHNVFNYVPTITTINVAKGHKFRAEDLDTLKIIQNIYGPRVMKILESYGAFENRAEDLQKLIHASIVKKQYGVSDPHSSKFDFSSLDTNKIYAFRKKSTEPSEEVIKILVRLAKEFNNLPELEFGRTTLNRTFQFEIEANKIPDLSEEDLKPFLLKLSYRELGAKIALEQVSSEIPIFAISRFDRLKGSGKVLVQIDFHPRFALKLLETPTSVSLSSKFIQYLFKTTDVNYQEFMEWHE